MNDTTPQFLVLHGQQSSVVLEWCDHEAPLWRYWGARLSDDSLPPSSLRSTRPLPPASLEFDQPLSIAPTFGNGWFGQAGLLAHRNGAQFAHAWNACAVERPSAQALRITLRDTVAAIRLVISMQLDSVTDVLEISSCLHNDGEASHAALTVQWLAAATLPLPAASKVVNSYVGQWANEFQLQTDTLSRSTWRRENTRGRTSHDCFPAATVLASDSQAGAAFGAHLGWSGNHCQSIEWQHDGQYQWQLGAWLAPGEVQLQAGESLHTPTVYAAFSPHGVDGLAHAFHQAVRQQLPWHNAAMPPRPVHLNTWEAVYFDHNEADLKALATAAAALGVERFVLDDGWFHGRQHDRAGLGDWWPDARKYPQGLLPLAQHVIAAGLSFGLWVEPEMVNADSDLFRKHPDWVLQLKGRPLLTGRNQLVLDIARAEVADYLFDAMHKLLNTLPISYLKWDMNRDLTHAGSGSGSGSGSVGNDERAGYSAYVTALYRLLARLAEAFPKVEIETCASGGGRCDYGILRYTHRVWASDCNDALSRLAIQHGALQWLPPEIIGCHVGSAPAHTTGRSQSLAFRAAVALTGHFGLEMDVRKLSADEQGELKTWIALYRNLRSELHQAQVWRSLPTDNVDGIVWQVHGKNNAFVACIYRTKPTTQRYAPCVLLHMLDATKRYVIENVTPSGDGTHSLINQEIDGAWLKQSGLQLPRMLAETALILRITPR